MKPLLALALIILSAQERITLTTPESNPEYRITLFAIVPDDPDTAVDEGQLIIDLKGTGNTSASASCRYTATTNPTGTFLNNALNKVNASTAYAGNATTGSLKQRIYHRLFCGGAGLCESPVICGKTLTGTLTGAVP